MAIQQPIQGLDTDISPKFQQPGTYRYAYNAASETVKGQDGGGLTNEQGNEICGTLGLAGARVCGSVELDDGTHLLFVKTTDDSRLTIYDPKRCELNNIMITPTSGSFGDCLNFDPCFPVRAEFRVREGCKRFIYFTDNNNPMRAINISSVESYLTNFEIDCAKFTHSPTVRSIPAVSTAQVFDSGGVNTPVGTVQYAIRLITSDGAQTNWLNMSETIPLLGTSQTTNYYNMHGSVNQDAVVYNQVPGEVAPTDKSVELVITNVDTNFATFQVAAIISAGAYGIPTEAYIHEEIAINGLDTITYVWRGRDATAIETSIDNIIIDTITVDKVVDLDQIDNRLNIVNVRGRSYDWATVQRAANDITAEWVEAQDQGAYTIDGSSPKHPNYYLNRRQYQRDEIYAFGVRGRFKLGGDYTPVFHIPGREADILTPGEVATGNAQAHYRVNAVYPEWDTLLYDVADPVISPTTEIAIENVRHLGFNNVNDDIGYGVGKVPRWLVFNTAVTLGTIYDDDFGGITGSPLAHGYMSYWESSVDYPDTLDCDGIRIYPTGAIRHHKFPDATLRTAFQELTPGDGFGGDTINLMGIRFDIDSFIAALPTELTDQLIGWEIVRVPRDRANKTVLDKGFIENAPDASIDFYDDGNPANHFPVTPFPYLDQVVSFDSPRSLLLREPMTPDYYKLEQAYTNERLHNEIFDYGPDGEYTASKVNYHRIMEYDSARTQNTTEYNRKINNTIYIDYADPFFDLPGYDVTMGFPTVTDSFDGHEVGNNWYTIPRFFASLEDTKTASGQPWGPLSGDMEAWYGSFKKYNTAVYSQLPTLIYHSIDNGNLYTTGNIVFGGDTYVTKWNVTVLPTVSAVNDPSRIIPTTLGPMLWDWYAESDVNVALRTEDDTGQASRSFKYGESFIDHMQERDILVFEDQGPNDPLEYRSFLYYNRDYSVTQEIKPAYPLDTYYDFCDECENLFPFRIRYSDRSYQEDEIDNYRLFLGNNYRDLDGETGEITNIFVQNDNLYVTTTRATYFVPVRPQTLETNESSAFIGIGDVLSIPPRRLLTSDFSFGGCSDPETLVTTEYGTVWADSISRKIFMLSNDGNVKPITSGLEAYFYDNLELEIACDLHQQLGLEWPCRSTLDQDFSAGMAAEYDSTTHTYYLHKKDYKLVDPEGLELWDTLNLVDVIVWDDELSRFGMSNGDGTYDSLSMKDETDYFINRSFTLSLNVPTALSPEPQARPWVSFHSWLPNYMFSDSEGLYSFKKALNDNTLDIWKHRSGVYNNFYGVNDAFQIEFTFNDAPNRTKTFDQLSVVMDVMSYDETKKQWYYVNDITWSNGVFFNDDQTSDEQRILVKDKTNPFDSINLGYTVGTILADRTTDQWNFSNIRDWSINHNTEPIWTSEWSLLAGAHPRDKIVNQDIIDYNTSLFEQSRIRGEWAGARLRFAQPLGGNYKFIVNLGETMDRFNMRDFKQPRQGEQR